MRGTCRPRSTSSSSTTTGRGCCRSWIRDGRFSSRSNGSCAGASVPPDTYADDTTQGLRPDETDDMLKGTRDGILRKVQPISIHGQVSWDVFFTDVDDPDGQVHNARIGPEAVIGTNLEPGDRIQIEYLV